MDCKDGSKNLKNYAELMSDSAKAFLLSSLLSISHIFQSYSTIAFYCRELPEWAIELRIDTYEYNKMLGRTQVGALTSSMPLQFEVHARHWSSNCSTPDGPTPGQLDDLTQVNWYRVDWRNIYFNLTRALKTFILFIVKSEATQSKPKSVDNVWRKPIC